MIGAMKKMILPTYRVFRGFGQAKNDAQFKSGQNRRKNKHIKQSMTHFVKRDGEIESM